MRAQPILVILMIFVSALVYADEVSQPKFGEDKIEYVKEHEISYQWDNNRLVTVNDITILENFNKATATIYIKTIGNNYHMCHVVGKVNKGTNGSYLFTYNNCQLKIDAGDEKATIEDVGGKCKSHYCGMMGYLNAEFQKQ